MHDYIRKTKKAKKNGLKYNRKMEIISSLYQFDMKKSYFESKSNIVSINLNYCNSYCLYSLQIKI